jgi:hypothetical protein
MPSALAPPPTAMNSPAYFFAWEYGGDNSVRISNSPSDTAKTDFFEVVLLGFIGLYPELVKG